ncbi:hypothetical protein [Actinokineospora enzanensis]|uniref:hypothetical protein n=1 Tax=Actinokineospora enzanensis TaxID=155975 RepID=UPI00036D209F|nr:hypothetical protein [Actinokineospora enzanensis]
MPRTEYGHADLDALITTLGLDSAGATVRIGGWPPILIRMAAHWFEHTQPAGGRIVFASPTVPTWQPRAHQRRSGLIDTSVDFAVIGVETVTALAGLLADDPLRNAHFGADVPDVPLRIDLDIEPMPAATPDATGIEGTIALMRITAPQHVPARFWPDDMETGAQERVTSIDYPQMLKTVSATWCAWLGC